MGLAIAIGVDDYGSGIPELKTAVNDVQLLTEEVAHERLLGLLRG